MSRRTFEIEKTRTQMKMSIKDYFGDSLGQFAISLMTTLAGLVIVLTLVIKEISSLCDTVRTLFSL